MSILPFLQSLFGWVYFFSWSATFWPQTLLIHRRRTTAGLSTDFVAINIVGFISYTIFTFSSYFVPAVTESYKKATGYAPQVELTDVLFATHGAIMCFVLVLQLFLLPPKTPPKLYTTFGCVIAQSIVFLGLAAVVMGRAEWYDYLRFAGNVKVFASLVKHFPQAFLNRARNSTVGWSFTMVLLDIIGGSFSVAQQIVRSVIQGNLAPFTSNLAKTFLAAESLLFDLFFIMQHTLFYTDRRDLDRTDKFEEVTVDEEHVLVSNA